MVWVRGFMAESGAVHLYQKKAVTLPLRGEFVVPEIEGRGEVPHA